MRIKSALLMFHNCYNHKSLIVNNFFAPLSVYKKLKFITAKAPPTAFFIIISEAINRY